MATAAITNRLISKDIINFFFKKTANFLTKHVESRNIIIINYLIIPARHTKINNIILNI